MYVTKEKKTQHNRSYLSKDWSYFCVLYAMDSMHYFSRNGMEQWRVEKKEQFCRNDEQ